MAAMPFLVGGLSLQAATTTPNVKVEILGVGTEFLLAKTGAKGPLTDPENDGTDEAGADIDPAGGWNWKAITSSEKSTFEGGEGSFNIFDHKVGGGNDKMCCTDPTPEAPVWVSVEFKSAVGLTHFTLATGNDTPGRFPTDFAIQGSNDGQTFTDIYHFVEPDTDLGAVFNQVIKFTLPKQSPAYTHIRYIAYDTPATLHQMNEVEYFGGPVVAGQSPLATGLKAYWDFEGNLKDTAGGAVKFDGTENGAAPVTYPTGKNGFGKALLLDGVDQFVEITGGEPDDLAFAGGSMTVAGWFKVGAFDKDWQALIAKGEGSNWRIHRRGGETGFAHAGGIGEGPAGGAVNDDQWHHFAAISDKDAVNFGTALYIDGVKYTEFASAPNLAANGKRVMIGENPDARGRTWDGLVDDIAIWDRVLTEAEITTLTTKPLSEALGALAGDADGDEMPDDFEVANGFNPNNKADAALDFDKDGVSNLDEYKAGTDPIDVTKPTVVSAAATGSFTTINVTFSEEVNPATATNKANYVISPALAISTITYSKRVASITTAAQAPGGTAYTVTVNNVADNSKNLVAADSKVIAYSFLLGRAGLLKFAAYFVNTSTFPDDVEGSMNGNAVQTLLDFPRYPATPNFVRPVSIADSRDAQPDGPLENYGGLLEGYLTPTEAGSYRFFIHSDDASQLYLSTDDKEANLAQIAEETGCCNNFTEPDSPRTSEPVALKAGTKYFIRMLYKEGGGGDYGRVAWRKEGDTTAAGSLPVIPGKFLSSAVDLPLDSAGKFITRTPGIGAKNVSPASKVIIAHSDGKTPWTAANTSLKFNGVAITPVVTKDAGVLTLTYTPPALLPSGSTNTVALSYLDAGGVAQTEVWSFTAQAYKGPTLDKVGNYPGLITGSGVFTDDKGGATGKAGDRAIDTTSKGGPVVTFDAGFLTKANAAMAKNELTVVFWQKKHDIADSSAFTMNSPGSGNNRGFHAHVPWSDQTIYFDTVGCCDGTTQRVNENITSFADYVPADIGFWTNSWHLFAFTKKGDDKNIYIDGKLFKNGSSTAPLPADIDAFYMGSGANGAELSHGLIDDFSVYSTALTEAQVLLLAKGTLPTALPAAAGLFAYWDFNTLPVSGPPALSMVRNANGTITLTFEGKLETADSLAGPWTVSTATSPVTLTPDQAAAFARARR